MGKIRKQFNCNEKLKTCSKVNSTEFYKKKFELTIKNIVFFIIRIPKSLSKQADVSVPPTTSSAASPSDEYLSEEDVPLSLRITKEKNTLLKRKICGDLTTTNLSSHTETDSSCLKKNKPNSPLPSLSEEST